MKRKPADRAQLPLPKQHRRQLRRQIARQKIVVNRPALDHVKGHPAANPPLPARRKAHLYPQVAPSRIERDLPANHRRIIKADAHLRRHMPLPVPPAGRIRHQPVMRAPGDKPRPALHGQRAQQPAGFLRIGIAQLLPNGERAQPATALNLHHPVRAQRGRVVRVLPGERVDRPVDRLHRNLSGRRPHPHARRLHSQQLAVRQYPAAPRGRVRAHRVHARREVVEDGRQRRLQVLRHRRKHLPVAVLHLLMHLVNTHPADAIVHRVLQQRPRPALVPALIIGAPLQPGDNRQRLAQFEEQSLAFVGHHLQIGACAERAGEGSGILAGVQFPGNPRHRRRYLRHMLREIARRGGLQRHLLANSAHSRKEAQRILRVILQIVAVKERDGRVRVIRAQPAHLRPQPAQRHFRRVRHPVQIAVAAEQVDCRHPAFVRPLPIEERGQPRRAPPDVDRLYIEQPV